MKWLLAIILFVGPFLVAFYYVGGQTNNYKPIEAAADVSQLNQGRALFRVNCASCHGEAGVGVEGAGPPFIHRIYEPNHHGDFAFYSAVQNGVKAHHWPYGNMPAQPHMTKQDAKKIIVYIRNLQKQKGIF